MIADAYTQIRLMGLTQFLQSTDFAKHIRNNRHVYARPQVKYSFMHNYDDSVSLALQSWAALEQPRHWDVKSNDSWEFSRDSNNRGVKRDISIAIAEGPLGPPLFGWIQVVFEFYDDSLVGLWVGEDTPSLKSIEV